ncbi:MAG: YciI family protein [Planctomycetota bacterium]
MKDYILLMHNDAPAGRRASDLAWPPYFAKLREAGAFQGGSAMGDGVCVRQSGSPPKVSEHLGGYIRICAADLEAARALVAGNPVYEAGATVEIRELPRDA